MILGAILISLSIGFLLSQTFQVNKISAQMSPPNGPLAGIKPVVGTYTFPPGGVTCTTPTDTDYGTPYCILSQVPLPNPPQSINCVWNLSGTGEPSIDDTWHDCYSDGSDQFTLQSRFGTGTDVFWKNGNLEFGLQQNSHTNQTIKVVYSAVSQ